MTPLSTISYVYNSMKSYLCQYSFYFQYFSDLFSKPYYNFLQFDVPLTNIVLVLQIAFLQFWICLETEKAPVVLKFQSKMIGAEYEKSRRNSFRNLSADFSILSFVRVRVRQGGKSRLWHLRKTNALFSPEMPKTPEKSSVFGAAFFVPQGWCGHGDLNPNASLHKNLRVMSPQGRIW